MSIRIALLSLFGIVNQDVLLIKVIMLVININYFVNKIQKCNNHSLKGIKRSVCDAKNVRI